MSKRRRVRESRGGSHIRGNLITSSMNKSTYQRMNHVRMEVEGIRKPLMNDGSYFRQLRQKSVAAHSVHVGIVTTKTAPLHPSAMRAVGIPIPM
jgi:hypothetical protein